MQTANIIKCIGCSSDNEFITQELTGLINRHIILSKMYTIYLQLLHQFYTVVENKGCTGTLTSQLQLTGYRLNLFIGSPLHAKLNPITSSDKCQIGSFEIREALVLMRDKLKARLKMS